MFKVIIVRNKKDLLFDFLSKTRHFSKLEKVSLFLNRLPRGVTFCLDTKSYQKSQDKTTGHPH